MSTGKRPVIVVADDDLDIGELVSFQLSRHGFEVIIAQSGEVAFQLIGLHLPVVALLDIMMPGLSGLEVARRVRADPATSHIGLVLFSARSMFGRQDEVSNLDIDDYISKPFSPKDLLQRINVVVARRTLQ